jgi:plastocyanin
VSPIPLSIVEDAALKGDKAYQPNPLVVNVGQELKWTHDDTQIHTATSGTVGSMESGKVFDSGILSPGATFSFTFEPWSNFLVYCFVA